jgi:hypothetical protein
MARRLDITEINLDAYDIEPFVNSKYVGFVIKWDSSIGFGEYTIYKKVGADEWFADSEHMDNNADKAFITELMKVFIDKLTIEH